MPRKTICTDRKLKSNEIRNTAGACYKLGLRSGYAAGIQQARKRVKRARRTDYVLTDMLKRRQEKPISRVPTDLMRYAASKFGIPGMTRAKESDLRSTLLNRGISSLGLSYSKIKK